MGSIYSEQGLIMNEFSRDGSDRRHVNDPEFWQELHDTFATALNLLHEIARAQGIDVDAPKPEDVAEHERLLDERARDHPLPRCAAEYAERVNRWFRRVKDMIHAWGREAAIAADLDAVTPELEESVSSLQEAVEEIAAHRYRIHVKILRAVRERMRSGSPLLSALGDTGDVAAAEAYFGIERSIQMWLRLREFFPEEEDAILNLLVHLQSLRDAVEGEFPEAQQAAGSL